MQVLTIHPVAAEEVDRQVILEVNFHHLLEVQHHGPTPPTSLLPAATPTSTPSTLSATAKAAPLPCLWSKHATTWGWRAPAKPSAALLGWLLLWEALPCARAKHGAPSTSSSIGAKAATLMVLLLLLLWWLAECVATPCIGAKHAAPLILWWAKAAAPSRALLLPPTTSAKHGATSTATRGPPIIC
jgi:hypothetical protein